MRGSALLPAGLELSLASDQRICASMARIGDRFSTHLDEDVVGPIGVVIPRGTPVVARVVSTKGDIDLVIESLKLTSRNYSPESLVTYTAMENVGYSKNRKDLCIPEGGDITARLVEPLRISL